MTSIESTSGISFDSPDDLADVIASAASKSCEQHRIAMQHVLDLVGTHRPSVPGTFTDKQVSLLLLMSMWHGTFAGLGDSVVLDIFWPKYGEQGLFKPSRTGVVSREDEVALLRALLDGHLSDKSRLSDFALGVVAGQLAVQTKALGVDNYADALALCDRSLAAFERDGRDLGAAANIARQKMMMLRDLGDLSKAKEACDKQMELAKAALASYKDGAGLFNAKWMMGATLVDAADLYQQQFDQLPRGLQHVAERNQMLLAMEVLYLQVDREYPDVVATGEPCYRRCLFEIFHSRFEEAVARAQKGLQIVRERGLGGFNEAQLLWVDAYSHLRAAATPENHSKRMELWLHGLTCLSKAETALNASPRAQDPLWVERIRSTRACVESAIEAVQVEPES